MHFVNDTENVFINWWYYHRSKNKEHAIMQSEKSNKFLYRIEMSLACWTKQHKGKYFHKSDKIYLLNQFNNFFTGDMVFM